MKLFGLTIQREAGASSTGSANASTKGANWVENIIHADSARNSMQVAAVYRCVELRSNAVAVMPLLLKSRGSRDGVFSVDDMEPEHWNYLLNARPNEWQNGYDLKKQIIIQKLLNGNAYLMATGLEGQPVPFNAGRVRHIYCLEPGAVSYDQFGNRYHVSSTVYGFLTGTWSAAYVCHIKGPSTEGGFIGESVISHAARTLNLASTGSEQALKTIASGGKYKMLISYDESNGGAMGMYDQKEVTGMADDMEKQLAQRDVVVKPAKGMTATPLSMSAADMQFLELMKASKEDIASWFGVPMYMLGTQTSNYKTVDASQTDFYNQSVQPDCVQIETELRAKVTDMSDYALYKFDFDERPLFTMDHASEVAWMKGLQETGVMSVNELRAERDLDPVEGGDLVTVSANLKSMSQLASEGQTTQEPTTQTTE